jgi:hypothetical protein
MQFPDDEDEDVLYVENYRGDMIGREEERELISAHASFERLRQIASAGSPDEIIDNDLAQIR